MENLFSFNSIEKMRGELKLLTRSENTERTYVRGLTRFFKLNNISNPDDFIERIKRGEVDANDVYKSFIINMASADLAPKSVSVWSASLRKFLSSNEIEITKKVPIKVYTIHEDTLPSKEELKEILLQSTLKPKVCILVMLSGGLRIGELHNLKVGDVDLSNEIPIVKIRSANAKERKGRITFLTPEARNVLKEYLSTRKNLTPDSPLVVTDVGNKMSYQTLQFILKNSFKKVCEKEGKRFRIHPHSMRKFFKTQLIVAGVPGPIVDRLTGHSRYLAQEYELYTKEHLLEWYKKGMERLTIM